MECLVIFQRLNGGIVSGQVIYGEINIIVDRQYNFFEEFN